MILLLLVAFLSGFITIFSPCIWPILPVVLSSSLKEGKKLSVSLIFGIITSFVLFTLFFSLLIGLTKINPELFRTIATLLVLVAGLSLVAPKLSLIWENFISRLSQSIKPMDNRTSTVSQSFLTGSAIGALWTPCSGPILITVATLAASRVITIQTFLITLSYASGVGLPLLILINTERWLINKSTVLTKHTRLLQKLAGVLMIASALLIYTNYDKTLQLEFLKRIPFSNSVFLRLEKNPKVKQEIEKLRRQRITLSPSMTAKPTVASFPHSPSGFPPPSPIQVVIIQSPTQPPPPTPTAYTSSLPVLRKAPDLVGITNWFNTQPDFPKTILGLRGNVVLIDFWAYTCSWCLPTIPYKNRWLKKYADRGFKVIGIHVPAVTEARSLEKIQQAIEQYKIEYPVAVDNDFKTWDAFKNQYLPGEYLIDINGYIRYTHFEAGDYDKTEKAIVELLKEK